MGLFGSSKKKIAQQLVTQTIGGQSVLYRLFRENLECEDQSIRLLELTYFAASVTALAYLTIGRAKNREDILDEFILNVFERTIPHSRESVSINNVVAEYQKRYREYASLFRGLIIPKTPTAGDPTITLMLHVFECVTGSSAKGSMIKIMAISPIISTFIDDHIDFIEQL